LFILFHFAIVLSALRSTASDYPFGIFDLLLHTVYDWDHMISYLFWSKRFLICFLFKLIRCILCITFFSWLLFEIYKERLVNYDPEGPSEEVGGGWRGMERGYNFWAWWPVGRHNFPTMSLIFSPSFCSFNFHPKSKLFPYTL
jgi:hypothetical protein